MLQKLDLNLGLPRKRKHKLTDRCKQRKATEKGGAKEGSVTARHETGQRLIRRSLLRWGVSVKTAKPLLNQSLVQPPSAVHCDSDSAVSSPAWETLRGALRFSNSTMSRTHTFTPLTVRTSDVFTSQMTKKGENLTGYDWGWHRNLVRHWTEKKRNDWSNFHIELPYPIWQTKFGVKYRPPLYKTHMHSIRKPLFSLSNEAATSKYSSRYLYELHMHIQCQHSA